jgi:AraC family transcriptional regulator
MADLRADIQNALTYIEENLTEELEIRDIAKKAFLSPFYFQRIFGVMCGISVGEYIRGRRLSLAGEELARSDAKVIDIAAKYGYDSPDSFNRAFQRFHGISPSAAKKAGARLISFAPVKIKQTVEGIHMMEYRIVEKPQFTVMGVSRKFHPETSYQQIPEYWTEMFSHPDFPLMGVYGICIDDNGVDGEFDYWIADNYIPWQEIPAGCKSLVIPGGTWAVFPCKLKTLQDTNTQMWQEWLPNCREYKLSGSYNLEVYGPPCKEDQSETYVELWLPVEKAQ